MLYCLCLVKRIYQFVCAKCDDLFTYALQKHVMLVSPTTLVAEVMTLLSSTKDFLSHKPYGRNRTKYFVAAGGCESSCRKKCKGRKTLETLATQFHAVSISAQKLSSRMTKMGEDE